MPKKPKGRTWYVATVECPICAEPLSSRWVDWSGAVGDAAFRLRQHQLDAPGCRDIEAEEVVIRCDLSASIFEPAPVAQS